MKKRHNPDHLKPFLVMSMLRNGNREATPHLTRESAERHVGILGTRGIEATIITREAFSADWEGVGYGAFRPKLFRDVSTPDRQEIWDMVEAAAARAK